MNIYERRRRALQHLLDYWEQSIGMMKAVDYVATDFLFVRAINWRAAIRRAIELNEVYYDKWKRRQDTEGMPPWKT